MPDEPPDCNEMIPEAPTLVVPVRKLNVPLTPAAPASFETIEIAPLDAAAPLPDAKDSKPPVPELEPAEAICTEPLTLLSLVPPNKKTEPDCPAVAAPEATEIWHLSC